MRKILLGLGLLSVMVLCGGPALAADEDSKPKKGKFGEKLKGLGKIATGKLFEKLDANNDGKISKDEFKKVFDNLGGGNFGDKLGALTDRLFDKLDTNSDGYLSKEEFEKLGAGAGGLKGKFDGLKGKFGKKGDKEEKKEDK